MSVIPTGKKDVEEMSFRRLTLVLGDMDGKKFQPMNPEATTVAFKAGEVDANAAQKANMLDQIKTLLGIAVKGDAPQPVQNSNDEQAEIAKSAMRSAHMNAMHDETYNLAHNVHQALNAPGFDDNAKKKAVNAVIQKSALALTQHAANFMAVKAAEMLEAQKAGARHNAQDLADIQATHDQVGQAMEALKTAHEATGRLLPDDQNPAPGNGAATGGDAASKSQESEMTPDEIKNLVADAVKAAVEAKVETKPATSEVTAADVANAVKAAIDPIKTELDTTKSELEATKAKLADAEKAASDAKAELETATKSARDRKAPGDHGTKLDGDGKAEKSGKEKLAEAKPDSILDAVRILTH